MNRTALWRLSPVDLLDPNWTASTHRGPAVVRAANEATARAAAQRAFGAKTRFAPGAGVVAPPWRRADLVRAEVIEDPRFAASGPTAVLDPSFDGDLAGDGPRR